jgi:large subunit ribosomal protein L21
MFGSFASDPYIAGPFFGQFRRHNMYAVVEIAGQQFTVAPKQTLTVPLLDKSVGDSVEFSNILLASNGDKVSVGAPYIKGSVKATVNAHGKGDKVLVFHKKRRKGYQKLNGHHHQRHFSVRHSHGTQKGRWLYQERSRFQCKTSGREALWR